MKIVMLCDGYMPESQYHENMMAECYVKHNHQVTVIASTLDNIFNYQEGYDKNVSESEQIINNVKLIRLKFSVNILNKIRRFKRNRIEKIFELEMPDMIYSHQMLFMLPDCVKYKKKYPKCRLIVDVHSDYINSARNWLSLNILNKTLRRYFFSKALKYIDMVYPVVPVSAVFSHEVYGVPYDKMKLLLLGADLDVSNKIILEQKGKTIRKELGIPDNAFVIFTGGKIDPVKKTDALIKAFLQLSDPHLYLIIVGLIQPMYTDYKAVIEKLMEESKQIIMTGWVPGRKVYEYMNASDIAVFPASQSVLWQQAIGMRLPLLVGGVAINRGKKIVLDVNYLNVNDNVIILNVFDDQELINALAKNIKILLENPMLVKKMSKGALRTVNEFLSYDIIVERTLSN